MIKTFNGKEFVLHRTAFYKKDAIDYAKSLRKSGEHVRITPYWYDDGVKKTTKYGIWIWTGSR